MSINFNNVSCLKSLHIAIDIVIICDYKKSLFKEVGSNCNGIAMFFDIYCNGIEIIV